MTGFLEQYAPLQFVRPHVWDNVHKEDAIRDHNIYLSKGGSYSNEDASYVFKLHDEDRMKGCRGVQWFLSQEEH